MNSHPLVEKLLSLPDAAGQRAFLTTHAAELDDSLAAALKLQADSFLRSDLRRSLETAYLLYSLSEVSRNPCHRALGLLAEANAQSIGSGNYHLAIQLYDQAAQIYESQGNEIERARAQVGKVGSLAMLGLNEEALRTGSWASEILEAHGQWRSLGQLTMNVATVHYRVWEDEKALALFDRAAEFYSRLGPEAEWFLPWIDQNRASSLRNLGRYRESIDASTRAWEQLSRTGQRVEAARARQNCAVTLFVLGRYNDALQMLNEARDVFLADGRKRDALRVDLYITDCLLQLRRFAEVLESCQRARSLFAELGTKLEVAQACLDEGVARAGLKQYASARAVLDEARTLFVAEDNRAWAAGADLETAAVLGKEGRTEESFSTARACASTFRACGLPVKEAQAGVIAAQAAAALDRLPLARSLTLEAADIATRLDVPSVTFQCHHLLGNLHRAQGELPEASTEYQQAIREVERLRGQLMVEYRAAFLEDKQGIYEDMVDVCIDQERFGEGLAYAERAKSRALTELLAQRLDLGIWARSPADQPLVEELIALRAERDRLYRRWEGRGLAEEGGWAGLEENRQQARQEVLALEKQLSRLWHRLLVLNADYAGDASFASIYLEPAPPQTPPGALLVEYFLVNRQLVAFLVTAEGIEARRLPSDLSEIERLTELLWLNLGAVRGCNPSQEPGLRANAESLLHRLYNLLLAPLQDALAGRARLIIVPHGLLHYLPFHALHDGSAFLLERHEISYLPNSSLLRYGARAQPRTPEALVVGHSHHGRLPYAVQEARSVAALLGTAPILEDEASLATLREAAPTCSLLHLAAHGGFRPDDPLFSGLALADGWLTTLDVFNLRLQASLVTLSACRSGQNLIGGGDELQGLMRAFLYAGAASLVLTLWAVEDLSMAQLMETFYRKLAEGSTKAAALRHAQRQFIDAGAGDARCAHPYYWAPVFLIGDTGPL
jgi:tetratricopeptide (TPR) repeat protein